MFSELHQKYESRGFAVYAVSVDEDVETLELFLSERELPFFVLHDPAGRLPGMMALSTMPSSFLLNRKGEVIFVQEGFSTGDEIVLEKEIREALGDG